MTLRGFFLFLFLFFFNFYFLDSMFKNHESAETTRLHYHFFSPPPKIKDNPAFFLLKALD